MVRYSGQLGFWRLGYYRGIKFEDWDEYCSRHPHNGQGLNDPNFKLTQFRKDNNANQVEQDEQMMRFLNSGCLRGVVWAVVKDPEPYYGFTDDPDKKRSVSKRPAFIRIPAP